MPQLSITPAVSPQPSAGTSQMSAPDAPATEGGEDGLGGAPGINFGAVLAKQLKGAASLQTPTAGMEGGDGLGNAPGINFGAVLTNPLKGVASLQAPTAGMEGGDGLGNAPGINFGAVLTKPLKGAALSLEQKKDEELSLIADKESAEFAANAGVAALPVDLSALTAPMLVPTTPVQAGLGGGIPVEASAGNPLMQLSKAGKARLAAEIAANGKNLPQAASPEQRFADKLATLVEIPADKTGGEQRSTDLPLAVNPSAMADVFRNSEPLPALPVAPKIGSSEWGGAVGEKIVWMVNQSHQVAELHLNPPNLGPLEVRLTISNDQASALFVSHHSAVREAIETALPRLREMLADNGIMLGNVTVGSESFNQQQAPDQGGNKRGSRGGSGVESVMSRMAVLGRPAGLAHDGMVDIFA